MSSETTVSAGDKLVSSQDLLYASVLASLTMLFKTNPSEEPLSLIDYHRPPSSLGAAGAISLGAHGAVYGFITFLVCSIGPRAAVIVGTSGIVGCFFVFVLIRLMPKMNFDNSIVQRIALPIIVGGLLLIPLADNPGKVLCGCLVNTVLAFTNMATWSTVTIENAEFRLQPIARFATRQGPLWIGFFGGAAITTVFASTAFASEYALNLIAILLIGIVVTSFSIYGADDSVTKRQLEAIMTVEEPGKQPALATKPVEPLAPSFKENCDAVCDRFGLSPREREVFFLLAKGRNAKFIQEELCISSSTVKTHIYRIYRKMGINSQQLLIDAVDRQQEKNPALPDR